MMVLPSFSGRLATSIAAWAAAPQLMPQNNPSLVDNSRAICTASSSLTLYDFVDDVDVEDVRNEASADALNRMLSGHQRTARLALCNHGTGDRFHGDRF